MNIYSNMNSTYQPCPLIIDPFILHFLSSTIEPPPPLPSSIFFYDPFLVVPPPPSINSSQVRSPKFFFNKKYFFLSFQISSSKSVVSSTRFRYTPLQLFTLHRIFIQLPYPSLEQRRLIAEHLHLDIEQIRIWFSNRRSRKRSSNYQPNLIQPTSEESLNFKQLFNQLNLIMK